ncbi:hypothetical protein ACIPZ8_14840 [Pseudomonas sp. NPDC089422]|uniref:hypothetical protein n=1 Tax=Pseudomonas sp. NPDC089422 TaxID=3364466 RepID=UPI0037F42A93
MSELKVHLSVCKDVQEVSLLGGTFQGGYAGVINPSILINEEGALEIDLSDIGHRPRMGEGKDIVLVNVMICTGHMTVIPVYKDAEVKPLNCCACNSNGCCVYGRSGCAC